MKVGDDDDAGLVGGTSTAGAARDAVRAVAWRRGADTVAGTLIWVPVDVDGRDDGRELERWRRRDFATRGGFRMDKQNRRDVLAEAF